MIFGYIDYVITGDSFTKFFRRIMSKKLPVSKMCEKNGKLTLRMPAEHCKALERLCDELGLEYTATKRHGSFVLAKRFFRKRRTCHRHCGCHAFMLLSIKRGGEV